jgi:lipopolysaccharide export LptBFGC system permease protein LptF
LLLYQAPDLLAPLLPLAAVGGALISMAPMLKRSELVALAASGVSVRRACRGIFVVGLLLGAINFALNDQIAPRLETARQAAESTLSGKHQRGQVWHRPETGSDWFATGVNLADPLMPEIYGLLVATKDGSLLRAERLSWDDERWWLLSPHLVTDDARRISAERLPCDGALALPPPAQLSADLASRYALTSSELISRGGRLNLSMAAQRILSALTPVLALLCALPVFARFANRDALIPAAIRALLCAAIPLGIIGAAGWVADSSSLPPVLVAALAAIIALLPGLILYQRWRV